MEQTSDQQFRIPNAPQPSPASVYDTPKPSAHNAVFPYAKLKEIEDRIHTYREVALEAAKANGKKIFDRSTFRYRDLTVADLIEDEAIIGGEIFGPGFRFWLGHKGDNPYVGRNSIGDWYISYVVPGETRKHQERLFHIVTRPTALSKIFDDGKEYPMTITEIETIYKAAPLAEKLIREKKYPLDDALYDLTEELRAEYEALHPVYSAPSSEDIRAREAAHGAIRSYVQRKERERQKNTPRAGKSAYYDTHFPSSNHDLGQ